MLRYGRSIILPNWGDVTLSPSSPPPPPTPPTPPFPPVTPSTDRRRRLISTCPLTICLPLPLLSLTHSLAASSLFYWLRAVQVMLPSPYFIICEKKSGSAFAQASERASTQACMRQRARSSSAEMIANNHNNNNAGGLQTKTKNLNSGPQRRCPVQ